MKGKSNPLNMPPGTRVWVYVCHSPGDQQPLKTQEAEIVRLVQEKQWQIDRVFRDIDVSSESADEREAFEQMICLAGQSPRPADLLIVWAFSSLALAPLEAGLYQAQLSSHGWQILAMQDDVSSKPLARIFEAMINWYEEQCLMALREDTKRGLLFIAQQGCVPGGPLAKGYTHHLVKIGTYDDGTPRMGRKPDPDPDVAPLVIRAFELKAQGASHSAIAQETGLYDPLSGSWSYFFRNQVYIGRFEFQDQVFDNVYPAIVPVELFDAVQERLLKGKDKES